MRIPARPPQRFQWLSCLIDKLMGSKHRQLKHQRRLQEEIQRREALIVQSSGICRHTALRRASQEQNGVSAKQPSGVIMLGPN